MSDRLKTGLILGGAGLAAYLLLQRARAQAAGQTTYAAGGVPTALSTSPGLVTAPPTAGAPATATAASSTSTSSRLVTVAKLAAAPVYYPTKAVISGASYVVNKIGSIF
jgi:hypothetical protein